MDKNRNFLNGADIRPVILPVDLAAGANTGLRVPLRNYDRAVFLFFAEQGTAGQDPIITLRQHDAASGGTSKNLAAIATVWQKENDTTLPNDWTVITQAAGATYTSETGGESLQMIVIEVESADLDVTNGFTHVSIDVPDTGATAGKIGCAIAILLEPRYASDRPATAA
jgi:hypothetical protein